MADLMPIRPSNLRATIPGPPVPFARPRFSAGRGYQDPAYAAWKRGAALILRAAGGGRSLARQPLALEVHVFHPRPKARPAHVDRLTWSAGVCCYAITTKDLDNIIKAVADALQDGGVIADDRWLVQIVGTSWYAPIYGAVGVDVSITQLQEQP